jgi:L-amino acid N-acyltransferase YncA
MELRLARGSDARGIADIYGPIVASTPISFEVDPPGEREMARRIDETLATYPWLVCEEAGRVAGYAYASRHRARAAYQWSVEVSAYVHPECRRRGIGRALYLHLFPILKGQGFFNAYAGITLPNLASAGLHESVGFRPVGVYRKIGYKAGAWHDVGWWELALQPTIENPPPPRGLAEARKDPQWERRIEPRPVVLGQRE